MKIFHSELSSNPGHFSFGYSVYGLFENTDSLSHVYEQGFLPAMIVPETPNLFYMTRGTRVVVPEFKELHKLGRVARKIESLPNVRIVTHQKEQFQITEKFLDFCLQYFTFRHGKDSMPKERLVGILKSPYLSHITEYSIDGETVAYTLEVQSEDFIHAWYYAYSSTYEGKHLGAYLLLDVTRRAKNANKKYVYLGITHGPWMQYKTIYQPLEYWNGREWVHDPKSEKLKNLLAADPHRVLTLTDEWRGERESFYSTPHAYSKQTLILRRLEEALARYPKTLATVMVIATLCFAAFALVPALF